MSLDSLNSQNSTQVQLQTRPWLVTSFVNQPSPWILRAVLGSILLIVTVTLAVSPFIVIQRKIEAPGRIVSQLGVRSVFTSREGTFRRVVEENQQILEGDQLGYVEIQGFDGTDIKRLQELLDGLVDEKNFEDPNFLRKRVEEISLITKKIRPELTEIDVGLPLAELSSLYNTMLQQKSQGRLAVAKETAPLKLSLQKLDKKIVSLKKGKRVRDLAFFIETIEEDARRLRSSIAQIENGYSAKLNETIQLFKAHVQRAQVQLSTIGRGAEMRSPIDGRIYKYHLQDKQQAAKGALVAEIIPKDSVVVVKLGVRAIDQPKVKPGQTVYFRLEAFPYQKYGTLSGSVLDVKPVSADGSFEVTASITSSEKVRVENLPIGSGVTGLVVFGSDSLFAIAGEKILGELK